MRRYKRLTIWRLMRYIVLIVLLFCLITYISLGRFVAGRLRVPVFSASTCRPFLCLFTTFRPGDYKMPVSLYLQR